MEPRQALYTEEINERPMMKAMEIKEDDELARPLTEEEFRKIGSELRAFECHVLDCVLDTIPDHLKAKAPCIWDTLKRFGGFFINRHHEFIVDGNKIKGSNIHSLIEDILMCCPTSGESKQSTRNDISSI